MFPPFSLLTKEEKLSFSSHNSLKQPVSSGISYDDYL